jgi:transcriptional regulator with XRE-family HTH domain
MVADGRIDIPDWAWHRDATRKFLAARDIAQLFKFASHFGGASQTAIAVACGLTQSRVNEIVHGRRQVSHLGVLTRIADGLGMPDQPRTVLGLAPRRPDREIVEVFESQDEAVEELRRAAEAASDIDVLAVRGLGIVGLNSSILRKLVLDRLDLRLRVLLVHPDSNAAASRAAEIGESPEQMAAGIRVAESSLRTLTDAGAQVELYWYRSAPVWRIFAVDGVFYVSSFDKRWEGHRSEISKIAPSSQGALYGGFVRMLNQLFSDSERTI